jgi:serine/threonine protein kinase
LDAHPIAHPSEGILQAYGLGHLDEALAGSVSAHLEHCTVCLRRVAELSADSFLGRVRDAQGAPMSTYGQSQTSGSAFGPASPNAVASPPSHTLPPGLVDHPDYVIKRELGRGGMGVVYLAHNTLLGRDEVLKVMGRHISDRPEVLERFLREIRSVAKLRHPNIVIGFHASRIGGDVVLSMEYVEGLDLSRLIKTKGSLPVAQACNFVYQAALGLQHAHEQGLVHRDIKPGNLMLARKGDKATIKILDFGLAKATREHKVDGALTSEGQALGTPDFIAPEQILDAPRADIRADIYSLGATLYYLLAGRPPFRATSMYEMFQAHISRDADPLNLIRPEVPVELAALVAKMMAKEPDRRFQTPAEVAQAIGPFFKKGTGTFKGTTGTAPRTGQPDVDHQYTAVAPRRSRPAVAATSSAAPASESVPAVRDVHTQSQIELRDADPLAGAARTKPAGPDPANPSQVAAGVRTARPPWIWPATVAALMLGFISLGAVVYIATDKHRVAYEPRAGAGAENGIATPPAKPPFPPTFQPISRAFTDPLLVITTNNRDIFDAAELDFRTHVDRDLKATFKQGRIYINEAFGRNNVLCTEPLLSTAPGILDFSRITKNRTGLLTLEVHGYPPAYAGDRGAGRIVVKSDGSTIDDVTIEHREGWKIIKVPFQRNEIRLEHHGIGWMMEFFFIDYQVLLDPTSEMIPNSRSEASAAGAEESDAVPAYKTAWELNGIAWNLATHFDASKRDGARAVEVATKACELAGYNDPFLLDTLAAAYAEVGNFSDAVKWQAQALERNTVPSDAADYRSRLDLYKSRKPYHQDAPSPVSFTPTELDRKAAQWVSSRGGYVRVRVNSEMRKIRAGATLPDGQLQLLGVFLGEQPDLTDQDLKQFAGLRNLREFNVSSAPKITDAGVAHIQHTGPLQSLYLDNTALSDAGFAPFNGQPDLQRLGLRGTRITDAALANLEHHPQLTTLALGGTRVTSAGLKHIRGLKHLEVLWLEGTGVDDHGLENLRGLTRLRSLLLWGTQVTDAGLVHLTDLAGLEEVLLGGTRVGDRGLAHLAKVKTLSVLWIDGTRVTDSGLTSLQGLTRLRQLNLNGTGVTDAGLVHLRGLTQLKELYLDRTKVTRAGAEEFKKSVPACRIIGSLAIADRRAEQHASTVPHPANENSTATARLSWLAASDAHGNQLFP